MANQNDPDETRTLRPLALPEPLPDPGAGALRRGVFLDCETTGLSHEQDQIIELALLPFDYTLDGCIAEVLTGEARSWRNDPGHPLAPETTHLTGLTDEDVRGERIDIEAASAIVERAHLVVAHNAIFDRPFVERVVPAVDRRHWACSRKDVPWMSEGFASEALHCLLCACGVYARDRHRALADCEAGVWLLAQRLPRSGERVLAALRRHALTETRRVWAVRAPFESKDLLRARGYRWMPQMRNAIERSWWTEVAPEALDEELAWLATTAYLGKLYRALPIGRVTARERWRADPTRCELLDAVLPR